MHHDDGSIANDARQSRSSNITAATVSNRQLSGKATPADRLTCSGRMSTEQVD